MTRSALIVAFVFVFAGCQPGQSPLGGARQADTGPALSPADVQLPPVPNLDLVDVPAVYDDGSRSVSGVLLNRDELQDTAMRVTGILQEIYVCDVPLDPDAGQAEEPEPGQPARFRVRPGCLRPHVYIADSLRSGQRLLVTGYDPLVYEPQLRPGTKYTFDGVYVHQTRGFISTEDGLLVVTAITGEGIVLPVEGSGDAQP